LSTARASSALRVAGVWQTRTSNRHHPQPFYGDIHVKLKPGMYVKVYQDPFTQKDYEGVGKIVRVNSQDAEQVLCEVQFRDEGKRTFSTRSSSQPRLFPKKIPGFER
jgi:hypothetical protein